MIIEGFFMESFQSSLRMTMRSLAQVLQDHGVRFCFIGGAAVNAYGEHRTTEDVDVLVDVRDGEKLEGIPIGFIRHKSRRSLQLQDPRAQVDVIFSGDPAGDARGPTYELPQNIDHTDPMLGVPIIDLRELIFYKVASGLYGNRFKDLGDVQALIVKNRLPCDLLDGRRTEDAAVVDRYREIWRSIKKDYRHKDSPANRKEASP